MQRVLRFKEKNTNVMYGNLYSKKTSTDGGRGGGVFSGPKDKPDIY
jgi:hypothetical protein